MLKVDLHVHTAFSDGDDIKRIVRYAKLKKLDALAVTDHNTLMSIKLAREVRDILIIPGIELNYKFAHMLILGINKDFRIKLSFYDMIDICEDNGYVTILAHPAISMMLTRNYVERNYSKIKMLRAIEVYNSMYPNFYSMRLLSEKLADLLGLTKTGGSDAHKAEYVGNCYTLIDAEKNVDDILQAIIKGRAQPDGLPSPLIERLKLSIKAAKHFISARR